MGGYFLSSCCKWTYHLPLNVDFTLKDSIQ